MKYLSQRFVILILLYLTSSYLTGYEIGEKLTFELSYGLIKAGNSTIEINSTVYQDSIDCVEISSLSKTNKFFDKIYKVRDRINSVWDSNENLSYRFSKKLHEGNYRQNRIHYYYPNQNLTVYMKKDKKATKYKTKSFEIPKHTHDILSAFYWARNQELVVGDTLYANITVDGKSYVAGLFVKNLDTIPTIYGDRECVIIEPMLKGDSIFKQTGKILIWLSNDKWKIPMKIESKIVFGSFKAILKEVSNVTYQKK